MSARSDDASFTTGVEQHLRGERPAVPRHKAEPRRMIGLGIGGRHGRPPGQGADPEPQNLSAHRRDRIEMDQPAAVEGGRDLSCGNALPRRCVEDTVSNGIHAASAVSPDPFTFSVAVFAVSPEVLHLLAQDPHLRLNVLGLHPNKVFDVLSVCPVSS